MTIAVAVIVVLVALYFTLGIRTSDLPEPVPVSPIAHLEDRKQAIYDNLRDLQFEYRLGKLSDSDYQQTKQALQRELALVLAETEQTLNRLGLSSVRVSAKASAAAKPAAPSSKRAAAGATLCPHCGARFPQPLKFCGECGKAMS